MATTYLYTYTLDTNITKEQLNKFEDDSIRASRRIRRGIFNRLDSIIKSIARLNLDVDDMTNLIEF